MKEGDYTVTLEMNGVSCVIGDKVNEKITVPSAGSSLTINPQKIEMPSKSMFFSKKGYDHYQASSTREAGSGMATGRRQHKPLVITKEIDKSTPLLAKSAGGTESNSDGEDEDCDGLVEITPMKGGQIKVKVTCNK